MRGGRVTSLLVAETLLSTPPPSPALVASQMATRYFGSLPSSCAGLVVASATEAGVGAGASCGFVLHATAVGHLPLIGLDTPQMETRPGYARLTYPITGGLLVRTKADPTGRSGSGSFAFEVTMTGASAIFGARVDDFPARFLGNGTSVLRRLLYHGTESLVHRVLVARFLRKFIRSLAS